MLGKKGTKYIHDDVRNNFFLQADKDKIVAHHNKLRAKIANGEEKRGLSGPQPPAANMKMLTWNDDLALVAQRFTLNESYLICYRIFFQHKM